eukprot:TRINITY_DN9872_c0_g1_i1.p1 TRINITY_DN9872_c0_g1~~TRINITY_DN9872_c0_g1_i1.p1  ORF type:complete len:299 (+),score=98.67 TRINITY_DN9872_c0_g1_i1:223-1119(+)
MPGKAAAKKATAKRGKPKAAAKKATAKQSGSKRACGSGSTDTQSRTKQRKLTDMMQQQRQKKGDNAPPAESDDDNEAGALSSFDSEELVHVDDAGEEEDIEDTDASVDGVDDDTASKMSSQDRFIVGDTDSSNGETDITEDNSGEYPSDAVESDGDNSVPPAPEPEATVQETPRRRNEKPAQNEVEAVQELMDQFTGDDEAQVRAKAIDPADSRIISVLQQQALGVTSADGKITPASLRVPPEVIVCCSSAHLSLSKQQQLTQLFERANEREQQCLRTMYPQYAHLLQPNGQAPRHSV